ncbi:MAG TPA: hypothetical protein VHE77_14790, partial [Dongiaceae bacterium]|nr:hypothetical protein [Dongiaceae bacterium]
MKKLLLVFACIVALAACTSAASAVTITFDLHGIVEGAGGDLTKLRPGDPVDVKVTQQVQSVNNSDPSHPHFKGDIVFTVGDMG